MSEPHQSNFQFARKTNIIRKRNIKKHAKKRIIKIERREKTKVVRESAPVSVSEQHSAIAPHVRGKPVKSESNSAGAIRIHGKALYANASVTTNSSNNGPCLSGSNTSILSPTAIDPKLSVIEQVYTNYAIRSLKIHYVNVVGSSKVGNLHFGISEDYETAIANSWTASKVMELLGATETPVWLPKVLKWTYDGLKTFMTSYGLFDYDIVYQAALCAFNSGSVDTSATFLGELWLEYEIDFYVPRQVLTSVAMPRKFKSALMASSMLPNVIRSILPDYDIRTDGTLYVKPWSELTPTQRVLIKMSDNSIQLVAKRDVGARLILCVGDGGGWKVDSPTMNQEFIITDDEFDLKLYVNIATGTTLRPALRQSSSTIEEPVVINQTTPISNPASSFVQRITGR